MVSPPKRNFPSVAVALPHKRQWIAHKWLDALKLRWSTRQAKTSAGLNMLQERHVAIFWQDWIQRGKYRLTVFQNVGAFFKRLQILHLWVRAPLAEILTHQTSQGPPDRLFSHLNIWHRHFQKQSRLGTVGTCQLPAVALQSEPACKIGQAFPELDTISSLI